VSPPTCPFGASEGRCTLPFCSDLRLLFSCEHSAVYEVATRSGDRLALKHSVRGENRRRWNEALQECEVTESIEPHPFLVGARGLRREAHDAYLLLEYCPGGDLCERLANIGRLDEHSTRLYAAQLVLALVHLHTPRRAAAGVGAAELVHLIHRDIKPDNVFVSADGYIKLGDFGFTTRLRAADRTRTRCGTSEYMAPEVVRGGGYDRAADYWSLGVMLYECICGATPFAASSDADVYESILRFGGPGGGPGTGSCADGAASLPWTACVEEGVPSPIKKPKRGRGGHALAGSRGQPAASLRTLGNSQLTNSHLPPAGGSPARGKRQPTVGSLECRRFVGALMAAEPRQRLGMLPWAGHQKGGFAELRDHPWFRRLDWQAVRQRKLPAPWVPPSSSSGGSALSIAPAF
jgi:serine/threonine protein kinase